MLASPFVAGLVSSAVHIVYFTTGVHVGRNQTGSQHSTGGARGWPEAVEAFVSHIPDIIGISLAFGMLAAVVYAGARRERQRRDRMSNR